MTLLSSIFYILFFNISSCNFPQTLSYLWRTPVFLHNSACWPSRSTSPISLPPWSIRHIIQGAWTPEKNTSSAPSGPTLEPESLHGVQSARGCCPLQAWKAELPQQFELPQAWMKARRTAVTYVWKCVCVCVHMCMLTMMQLKQKDSWSRSTALLQTDVTNHIKPQPIPALRTQWP